MGKGAVAMVLFAATAGVIAFGVILSARAAQAVMDGPAGDAAPVETAGQASQASRAPTSVPAWTAPAPSARMLHKCRAPSGELSFLDHPCPAGHAEEWARPFSPDTRPAATAPGPRPARPTAPDSGPRPAYAAGGPVARTRAPGSGPDSARCRAAKQREADYRRRRGLDITHAELRRLMDQVYEACK